jgi:hypothetical protein
MRGPSEGYVAECCVSMRAKAEAADVRKWAACMGGSKECNRTESTGGRIWCS